MPYQDVVRHSKCVNGTWSNHHLFGQHSSPSCYLWTWEAMVCLISYLSWHKVRLAFSRSTTIHLFWTVRPTVGKGQIREIRPVSFIHLVNEPTVAYVHHLDPSKILRKRLRCREQRTLQLIIWNHSLLASRSACLLPSFIDAFLFLRKILRATNVPRMQYSTMAADKWNVWCQLCWGSAQIT